MVKNISSGLLNSLAIVGILGIIFIGLGEFFNISGNLTTFIIFTVLGIGLILESQIRQALADGGISVLEIGNVITALIGGLLIFAGATLFFPNAEVFRQTRIIAVIIALVVVIFQRFIPQN